MVTRFDLIILLVSSSLWKIKLHAGVLLVIAQLCSDLPVPHQCVLERHGLMDGVAG